jgi:hypothetical protein
MPEQDKGILERGLQSNKPEISIMASFGRFGTSARKSVRVGPQLYFTSYHRKPVENGQCCNCYQLTSGLCEISGSHGDEYENSLLGYSAV